MNSANFEEKNGYDKKIQNGSWQGILMTQSEAHSEMQPEKKISLREYFALSIARAKSFEFWRNMAVHFCICSVVGHWLEIPWCIFTAQLGIYDPNSLVWGDPFYPFMVYGVGAIVCALFLTPLKDWMIARRKTITGAAFQFYITCVVVTMLMELGMGLLMNQPDASGVYPIWDNSQLPLNIMQQAWLPNDLLLGACALLYTWIFYPMFEYIMSLPKKRTMNCIALVIVILFVFLCIAEFTEFI